MGPMIMTRRAELNCSQGARDSEPPALCWWEPGQESVRRPVGRKSAPRSTWPASRFVALPPATDAPDTSSIKLAARSRSDPATFFPGFQAILRATGFNSRYKGRNEACAVSTAAPHLLAGILQFEWTFPE